MQTFAKPIFPLQLECIKQYLLLTPLQLIFVWFFLKKKTTPEPTFPSPPYELSFFNLIRRSRRSYSISTLSNAAAMAVFLKRLFIY